MYYNINGASSSSKSTRNGISGLFSGLDTDTLVKNMTLGIRSKIAKQQQQATLLSWRTDAYRSITNKLIDFSNKYLTYSSSTNALSASFFNKTTVKALGDNAGAVTVTGSSASAQNLSIQNINSVASTASILTNTPASSGKISTGTVDFSALGKEVNNLAGETINLQLGSTKYNISFDKDFDATDAGSVASAFNAALAKVEVSEGVTLADKFSMTVDGGNLSLAAVDPTSTETLKVIGGSGSSLKALGIEAGASASGATPMTGTFDPANMTSNLNFFDTVAGKSINVNYNGVSKSITLPSMEGVNDKNSFLTALQKSIDSAFGANRIKVDLESDKFTFETVKKAGDGSIEADNTSTLQIVSGGAGLFGDKGVFNIKEGLSNRLILGYSLNDNNFATPLQSNNPDSTFTIKVNDSQYTFNSTDSINKILQTINDDADSGVKIQYLSTTNRFSITATESGANGRVEISDLSGNLAAAMFGTEGTGAGQYKVNAGTDAEIEVSYDGGATTMTLSRSSNVFDIDGLNVTLNAGAIFKADAPITFESKANTDDIFKNIKSLIDDYNSIIELTNKELTTAYARGYAPLTSEQREEMSESEIKTWEEKAKTGLLYNDSTIRSLSSDLRFALSMKLTIYGASNDIGLSTSTNYADNGKIMIDEDKLRKAIDENSDDLRKLFTDSETGIMKDVKTIMDKYAATVGEKKGSLITLAGVENTVSATQNTLSKQIESIEKAIKQLQANQKLQEDRYYRQFTSLETYIAQMSAQSSWLTQQTGG